MRTRRPLVPVAFVVRRAARPGDDPADAPPVAQPPVDVVAEDAAWRLVFEVPGADPTRISVEIHGTLVTVRGERRPTDPGSGTFLRVERVAGLFERSLRLDAEPEPEGALAEYADGLLTVTLPKKTAPRGRSIPIRRAPTAH